MIKGEKGFTLIELLGVIVILVVLMLVAFPNIMNQFRKNKDEISEVTQTMIKEATNLYLLDHPNEYPKENGQYYCISMTELLEDNRLSEPLIEPSTGKEISIDYQVKALVKNNQFSYEIVTDGSCIK